MKGAVELVDIAHAGLDEAGSKVEGVGHEGAAEESAGLIETDLEVRRKLRMKRSRLTHRQRKSLEMGRNHGRHGRPVLIHRTVRCST